MEGILTGTTTLGQSESGSNGNEEVLHTPPDLQNCSLTIRCSSIQPFEWVDLTPL